MVNDWKETTLGELGEVARGRSRHRPRYAEHLYGGKYPFIQTGDVKASNGRITHHIQTYSEIGLAQSRLWPAKTMCITIAANIAETGVLKYPACFPDSIIGFIANKDKCDVYFIEYMFRFLRRGIQHAASGSVQDNINLQTIDRLKFLLPSVSEQKAIAYILGSLDDKIELNRQMNTTLEAMAQALFKSWFVDFDPVIDNAMAAGNFIPDELEAKAAARQALGDARKPLPEDIRSLFPNAFVFTEEMGWIPEGWEVGELAQKIDVLNGFAFKSGDYSENGIFVLRTKNFNNNVTELLDDDVFLPEKFTTTHAKYLCEPFDYHLIMVGASVGNRGIIYPNLLPALRNQNMWCFRTKKGSAVGKCFIKYMLDSIIDSKINLASGSAREFFRKGDFQNHIINYATEIILRRFEEYAFPLLESQSRNEEITQSLKALRDTLLPKLLSGELRIPEAEALVEEAIA